MISVYPFGSGSLYTASYAISASYAVTTSNIVYAISASNTTTVLTPRSGSSGKGICLLTLAQYQDMVANNKLETCSFSS